MDKKIENIKAEMSAQATIIEKFANKIKKVEANRDEKISDLRAKAAATIAEHKIEQLNAALVIKKLMLKHRQELEEAAVIDGCNPYQVFFRVVLPLIRPGLAAAAIFTFRIAWNEFILSLVLTNRYTRTLPVATSLFLTDHGIQWGKNMAMGTLIALPPLIFTFIAARQIITGLTAGAVKG